MKERGRRVADRNDRAFQVWPPKLERRRRAGIAHGLRERRNGGIAKRADHNIFGRQPRARNSFRDHARVAQDRGASLQGGARSSRHA